MTYIGIDLGTSGVKATLVDSGQAVIASRDAPLSVSRPHPGWSEQDPADWIAATGNALDGLARDFPVEMSAVRGIGLSGQMHGATLLDAGDAVLRPCILWNDTRSHAEAAELDRDPAFRRITGNIVFPGFTAPKILWVREHEADIHRRIARILLPKDYLRLWMTGEYASDMSDASGTSWLDVGARRWSDDLIAASGASPEQMPGLVEGSEPSGTLRAELASRWKMDGRPVIAGGGGDNAASAVGIGVARDGETFLSLGTSGVLFTATDRFMPDPDTAVHAFCHALPDRWHQMGVILSATDALNWLSAITGQDAGSLTAELGEAPEAPSALTFLPYLSGERTPHNDAAIRGAFMGLEHASDRRVMTQAVLEGVAFAMRDCMAALESAGGKIGTILAVGGGSRSAYWLATMATVLDRPIDIPRDGDFGAAFGAARLAMLAADGGDWRAVCTPPAIARTIEPQSDRHADYDAAYRRYRQFYQQIRDL